MKEDDRRRAIQSHLARLEIRQPAALSTGFESLDAALKGGIPRGMITEIFGGPGCGKTTCALRMVAALQARGLAAAWIDADRAFDPAYAADLGVSLERLPVVQAQTAEESMEIARKLTESAAIDLLAIDSLAALIPAVELEIGVGVAGPGLQARVVGSGLRRLGVSAFKTKTAILVLNQVRSGPGPDAPETSAGGLPVKLYSGVRIALEPVNKGRGARFRIWKSRVSTTARSGELRWESSETL